MNDFLNRMNVENAELTDKLQKLREFIPTAKFQELTGFEQGLLHSQEQAMSNYQVILAKRIQFYTKG